MNALAPLGWTGPRAASVGVAYARCRVSAVHNGSKARFGESTRWNVMSCPTSFSLARCMHAMLDVAVGCYRRGRAVSLGSNVGRSLRSARLQASIGDYSDATPHVRRDRPPLLAPPLLGLQGVCPRYAHGVSGASISDQSHSQSIAGAITSPPVWPSQLPRNRSTRWQLHYQASACRPDLRPTHRDAPQHHIPAQMPSALEHLTGRGARWPEDWRGEDHADKCAPGG